MKTFKFYADAGHGWLAVKREFLKELGIAEKISPFSYQKGATVYVEEDGDLDCFINAMTQRGLEQGKDYRIVEPGKRPDRSPIRYYPSYVPG